LCLISLGLIVSTPLRNEELADGVLNLTSWPMLLLSGVWFSLEGTNPAAQALSQVFHVAHMVAAARRVMIDGAGVLEVLPESGLPAGLALAQMAVAARLFRWE
jgi:ABC-type multidrug transport system permease subunit